MNEILLGFLLVVVGIAFISFGVTAFKVRIKELDYLSFWKKVFVCFIEIWNIEHFSSYFIWLLVLGLVSIGAGGYFIVHIFIG